MSYANITNENVLVHANLLVKEWASQFENPPEEMPVVFSINDSGMLCANGVVLFSAGKFVPDGWSFEVDALYLETTDGEQYEIGINWRVAGPPYVSCIYRIAALYTAP